MGKVYFVSDSHLGIPDYARSLQREKHLVRWLEDVAADADEIFLLGDIFDFWFEYRYVVPRGYVRLLGMLARLSDQGIKLHYFTGNHDLWAFGYFEQELGVTLYREPIRRNIQGKSMLIGHGDGLGPGDHGYKLMKKVFTNRICQRMFSWLHPGFAFWLAGQASRRSRLANGSRDSVFLGEDREFLIAYCREQLKQAPFDYFIFGHRHLPMQLEIAGGVEYLNTGDWVSHFSYAEMENGSLKLKYFKPPSS